MEVVIKDFDKRSLEVHKRVRLQLQMHLVYRGILDETIKSMKMSSVWEGLGN